MVKIGICENEGEILQQIKQSLDKLNFAQQIETAVFMEPAVLLQSLKADPTAFDILLLNLQMAQTNGVDIVAAIRSCKQDMNIVLMGDWSKAAIKQYVVGECRYLMKPIVDQRLREVVDHAMEGLAHKNETFFTVMTNLLCEDFALSDILYFKGNNRTVELIGSNQKVVKFNGKLEDLEQLEELAGFLRPHQSYLVNIQHIAYLDRKKKQVVMKNQDTIPIRKSKLEQVVKKYIQGIKTL